jgi:IclR family transcriptional regulator, acetate operon repressor
MSRVLRLFDRLARSPAGLTLSELAVALDVSKSTLLPSLRALAIEGFVIAENHRYRLGAAALRLAGTILSSAGQTDIVRYHVRQLAAETRESVGYAIPDWDIGQVIYTEAVNSTQPVHYAMRAGIRAPLYASAAGRVLLAFAPEERRRDYFARAQLKPLTSRTATDRDVIEAKLAEVARLGYCASFGEMLKDTAAIAVPVHDPNGSATGALMIAAPLDRMRANLDRFLDAVRRAGRLASGRGSDEVPMIARA